MGGITGFIDPKLAGGDPRPLLDPILAMNATTPPPRRDHGTGGGHWLGPNSGVALGAGPAADTGDVQKNTQPITSSCGRYVLALDGAIRNAKNLRDVLMREGRRFSAGPDALVLVESFSAWGIDRTLDLINGPFAIALWDKRATSLTLARDRMGIKPLYWGLVEGMLVWGSQLKALRAKPGWTARLNRPALTAYLRYGWVPAPLSIYQDIHALSPAHRLTYQPASGIAPDPQPYWDFYGVCAIAQRRTEMDGVETQLETLLSDAVRRCIATSSAPAILFDGAHGGAVGGALLASLAQAESHRQAQSFSVTFEGRNQSDAIQAADLAQALGVEHTVLAMGDQDLPDLIPTLLDSCDTPLGVPSAVATYLLGQRITGSAPALLSAAGAEELFFGRDHHRRPLSAGAAGAAGATAAPKTKAEALARLLSLKAPSEQPARHFEDKAFDAAYRATFSLWRQPSRLTGVEEPALATGREDGRLSDPGEHAAYLDTLIRLPGAVLSDYDQSMAGAGLNVALPFLDHRLVEFAWTLPKEEKIGDGAGMAPLRAYLDRRTPGLSMEPPLSNTEPPIGAWLRGPLKDWAMDLLRPEKLKADNVLKPEPIVRAWIDHLKQRADHADALWPVLMFQAWRDRWRPAP